MRSGRPLRFLLTVLGGWTAMRVGLLWPTIDGIPALVRAVAPPLAAAELPKRPVAGRVQATLPIPPSVALRAASAARDVAQSRPVSLAVAAPVRVDEPVPGVNEDHAPPPTVPPPLAPAIPGASRLAGSAWLLARGGAGGTLTGGRLGGSQAGLRVTYAIDPGRRVALAARVATPLEGKGREAAIGIEWRPTVLPIRIVAEQRFSLDGGRGGPTLMAIGGFGPTALGAGFTLEAYAQGGAVKRSTVEGFADGATRLVRPLAAIGRIRLDAGAGAWGAVQREAGRLDLGPTLGAQVPAGRRSLRLTLDWRQRVAGRARPGSGPAVSLGTDF